MKKFLMLIGLVLTFSTGYATSQYLHTDIKQLAGEYLGIESFTSAPSCNGHDLIELNNGQLVHIGAFCKKCQRDSKASY